MTWLSEENIGYRNGIRFLHNQEKSSSNPQDSFNNQVFGGLSVTFVFGRGEDKGILIHICQLVNRLSDTPCVNKKEIKAIVGNSWEAQAHLRSTSGPRWMYPHMYTHTWTFTLVFRHKELIELNSLFMHYVNTSFYLKDSFIYQIWFDTINVIFITLMLRNHSHRNWVMSTNLSQVEAKAGKFHYQRLDTSLSTDWSNILLVLFWD